MTASEFAILVGARRVGRGKWMALCPVHGDHNRSLSIAEGKKIGIVFICRSHACSADSILRAMDLTWQDILGERPTDPRKLRELEMKRQQAEAARRREKYQARMLIDQCRYWEHRYTELGAELALHDSDKTARLFHEALARFRSLEAQCEPILHPKGV